MAEQIIYAVLAVMIVIAFLFGGVVTNKSLITTLRYIEHKGGEESGSNQA